MTSGLLYVSDLLLIYKKSRAILLSSFPGPRFHDSTSIFLVALSEKIYIAISIHQAIRASFMDLRIGKKGIAGNCCARWWQLLSSAAYARVISSR